MINGIISKLRISILQKTLSIMHLLLLLVLLFSRSVMSDSLRPHGLQHARLHHLLDGAQSYVHQVGDAIQPSRPLLSPPLPTFNLFQTTGIQNI